jgi:hypothetical protein
MDNNYYKLLYVNDNKTIVNKSWWDDPWTVNEEIILLENDKVVDKIAINSKTFQLRDTIGFYYKNETIIYVYYGYGDSDALLKIDFYNISEDNKLNKFKEESIKLNCSCGNCEGRLFKLSYDFFMVIWGDLTNNDYYNEVIFEKNSILMQTEKTINKDFSFDYYQLTINFLLESSVIAFKNNKIAIKIINVTNDNLIYISDEVELEEKHNFDNYSEVESKILDHEINNNEIFILLSIDLMKRINVLKIEEYKVFVLVNINKPAVIQILENITNNIKPSIIIKDNVPIIWHKNIKI